MNSTSETGSAKSILPSLITGGLLGSLQITFCLAYAALLFSGELAQYLPLGVGLILLGTSISLVTLAIFSSFSGSVGSAQDIPTILLAVMVTSVIGVHDGVVDDSAFSTVIAIMLCCSFLTGVLMLVGGMTGVGKIIRYIPFPVMGGILAGTGWVLAILALEMMTSLDININSIDQLFQADILVRWIPGLLIAILIFSIQLKVKSPLVLPAIILLSFFLFHIGLQLVGVSLDEATLKGLLLQTTDENIQFVLAVEKTSSGVDWRSVVEQLPLILSLCLVSTIISLVQVSSIEVVVDQEMDMNRELRVNGLSNLLIGIFGGVVAFHHISQSTLAYRFGTTRRLTGIVAAGICTLPFFFGSQWLGLLPIPILAGIILYLGIDFLYSWIIIAYKRLPFLEYLVVLAIFLTLILLNFPAAIFLGLTCGAVLFLVRYSRKGVINSITSGADCRSSVMRSNNEETFLEKQGDQIALLRPIGFLFFGTSSSLFDSLNHYIESVDTNLKVLVLDFSKTPSIDLTAGMGLSRIRRLLKLRNTQLLVSSIPEHDRTMVQESLYGNENSSRDDCFETTDEALEAAENIILKAYSEYTISGKDSLSIRLLEEGWNVQEIKLLKGFLQLEVLEHGQKLISAGSCDTRIAMIDSGALEVRQHRDGRDVRLRVFTSGMVVGEMTIYTGIHRSADVVSQGVSMIFVLAEESLVLLEIKAPQIAIKLHRFFAKNLATKLYDDVRLAHLRS